MLVLEWMGLHFVRTSMKNILASVHWRRLWVEARPLSTWLYDCMHSQDGSLLLDGKTPEELGVPQWRTQVTYVPQSRTQQKGTPSELYYQAQVVLAPHAWHHPPLITSPDYALLATWISTCSANTPSA